MADKLRLGNEVRELKIGQSFSTPKAGAFHTIRYDFKPASVDINKIATVDVGNNNQVTVTVPHLDGAGVPQTVFKGSQRPFQKECVLIIDRVTGQITLEKLTSNIQVKKTRSESMKPSLSQDSRGAQQQQQQQQSSSERTTTLTSSRPQTPPATGNPNAMVPQVGQRQSNKTKMTTGNRRTDRQMIHLVPKHSPLHASPNPNYPSPGHNHKSPKRDLHTIINDSHSQSTLASLPMIGIDDFSDPPATITRPPSAAVVIPEKLSPPIVFDNHSTNGGVAEMTDSSSSDSSSDSDTDHIVAAELINSKLIVSNGHTNGVQNSNSASQSKMSSMHAQLLTDDLCLSESGSDSD